MSIIIENPRGKDKPAVQAAPPSPAMPVCWPVEASASVFYATCKSVLDWTLSLVMAIFAAPIVLFAMLLIKITSRGPALYTQTRVGKHGQPFVILKLRTMVHQCENLTGA